jgi:voltage-gated potassium channel
MRRHWWRALRHRLYEILEHGPVGDRTGRVVGRLIVLLIVINLVAITLQTVPEFETWYAAWFLGIELVSLVVFTRIAGAFRRSAARMPPISGGCV